MPHESSKGAAIARALLAPLVIAIFALASGLSACSDSTPGSNSVAGVQGVSTEIVGNQKWVGSWAAAPYGPYPLGPLNGTPPLDQVAIPPGTFFSNNEATDQSFRMMVHPTLGGSTLRIRFSNLRGTKPLAIGSVTVAKRLAPSTPAISTPVSVKFAGRTSATVPVGEELISDATELSFIAGDDLAISFYLPGPTGPMTWHAISFATSYVAAAGTGDQTTDRAGALYGQVAFGWFFISGVDVLAPLNAGAIVAFGDSITDGTFSTPDANDRWPDRLAQRLQALNIPMSVLNEGINSNTVVSDAIVNAGDTAVKRFERDVLQRSGVRTVIILEGTNDVGHANTKAQPVFDGLTELARRAHAKGICVVVATLLPRDDPPQLFGWDAAIDGPQRLQLNELIRRSPDFDAVVDWARTMEQTPGSEMPNPALFVERLHPNTVGFRTMSEAIPIPAVLAPPFGTCTP